uniref:Uncharacterized protein n=1 Tax=Rhizophora mucronata TaxID=61149 RepID=A0A2P2PCP0_RHIMU
MAVSCLHKFRVCRLLFPFVVYKLPHFDCFDFGKICPSHLLLFWL